MTLRGPWTANALSNCLALGINAAIGIALTPLIITTLGKSGYGAWAFIASVMGYAGLLEFGISSAVLREVARREGFPSTPSIREVLSTAVWAMALSGALIVVASWLLADIIVSALEASDGGRPDVAWAVRALGTSVGLQMVSGVFRSALLARELFVVANFCTIVSSCFRAGITVALLYIGSGLLGIAVAYVVGSLTLLGMLAVCVSKCMGRIDLSPKWVSRGELRSMLTYGGTSTTIAVALCVRDNSYTFVAAASLGLEAVAIFAVAWTITRYAVQVVNATMGVFTPRFAALDGREAYGQFRALFLQSIEVSSVVASILACTLALWGPAILSFWVGPDFREAEAVLIVLAVIHVVASAQNPGVGAMFALRKHNGYAVAVGGEAAMTVMFGALLAPNFGILGVAVGKAASMLLTRVVFQPIYACRVTGVSLGDYTFAIARGSLCAVLGSGSVFLAISSPDGAIGLGACIASSWILSGALFVWLTGRTARNSRICSYDRYPGARL